MNIYTPYRSLLEKQNISNHTCSVNESIFIPVLRQLYCCFPLAKIGFKAVVLYTPSPLQPLIHAPYCDTNVSLISCLQDLQLLMLQLPERQPALLSTPQEPLQLLNKTVPLPASTEDQSATGEMNIFPC